MGANDYMYTGVQRDAAATVSKRQPYCVLINYVASSLFVYVATTLTILRRPIEACYVGRVKKSQYDYYRLTAYNNNHEFKNSTVSQYTIMPRNNTIDSMSLDYFLRFEEQ